MVQWVSAIKRVVFALAGAIVGGVIVAFVEARNASAVLGGSESTSAIWLVDYGVLGPLALLIGAMVAAASLILEPERARSFGEMAADLRAQPVFVRSRTAAALPLAVFGGFLACVLIAHVARGLLSEGTPKVAGLELATASSAILAFILVGIFAVLPWLRRVLAQAAARSQRFVDPATTLGVSLAVVALLVAIGILLGDTSGDRDGFGSSIAILGVLKRKELDLRPVMNLLIVAAGAYLAPVALAQKVGRPGRVVFACILIVLPAFLTPRASSALNSKLGMTRAIEQSAPLGKIGLSVLRRATDHDKDGASASFGGGDCNDKDPAIHPDAIDVPGDGVDQDCSGIDAPVAAVTPRTHPTATPDPNSAPLIGKDYNLVFITIDTLRTDVGFMGYPKPVTPNLDKLAEKAVVFDRMYAMASYTGKSLPPMLIGKYPSETKRNGAHFNTYTPENTFIQERLQKAGVHTMGVASHWYFKPGFGFAQGMDVWDLTAMPPGSQGDADESVTSSKVTDSAIRLLKDPKHSDRRFYMWVHYFDPHAQYVPHAGAPDLAMKGRAAWVTKAAYDAEVWFVDQHVGRLLDFITSQPWGENTAVVVTSDHGEAFAEHDMSWHGRELWEVLTRVPMIVYVPGIRPHHVTEKRSHVDLVPTLLDVMRVPVPESPAVSGDSMVPCLYSKAGEACEEKDVFLDMPVGPYTQMRRAIIYGQSPGTKLIHFGGRQFQLFDLASDPEELHDLSSDSEKLAEAVRAFEAKKASVHEIYVKPDPPDIH